MVEMDVGIAYMAPVAVLVAAAVVCAWQVTRAAMALGELATVARQAVEAMAAPDDDDDDTDAPWRVPQGYRQEAEAMSRQIMDDLARPPLSADDMAQQREFLQKHYRMKDVGDGWIRCKCGSQFLHRAAFIEHLDDDLRARGIMAPTGDVEQRGASERERREAWDNVLDPSRLTQQARDRIMTEPDINTLAPHERAYVEGVIDSLVPKANPDHRAPFDG